MKPISVSLEGPLINKVYFCFNIHDQINTDGSNEFFCFLNLKIFGRFINEPKHLMKVKLKFMLNQ